MQKVLGVSLLSDSVPTSSSPGLVSQRQAYVVII